MHIHLPKPLHGWRQVFGEVGIIVVGILIALGAEQAVETLHHRSQVKEATEKLRVESLENRAGMAFNLSRLEEAITAVDGQLATLGDCSAPVENGRIARVQPVSFLGATDSAWLGVRDSALAPLMPNDLVQNYLKMDMAGVSMRPMEELLTETRTNAEAAVDVLRHGLGDQQACREAAFQLLRLRAAQRTLWRRAAFYHFSNEQIMQGEHLTPRSARTANRQVDEAESLRLPRP